jgi:aminoglycoside phosphotransferase (APT) family kinase protein
MPVECPGRLRSRKQIKHCWSGEVYVDRSNAVAECVQSLIDPGIATLSEVLDPTALAEHLRVISHGPWSGVAVEEVRVVGVLKHHVGKRCTFEIGLRTEKGWHSLVGKVYRKDRAADVFQAMEGIRRAGFGPRDQFSIPQPFAYLPSLRLLVQEKVEGPLANEIFKTGDEQSRAAAAERCALWLARFHAAAPMTAAVSYPHEYLQSKPMQRSAHKIAGLTGTFAAKGARLLQRLEEAVESLSPVEMRAGHGSYNAAQVILAPGRTVVFDWDWYDVADPARDVGRFLYALRRWALDQLGSIRALDAAAEVFLRTYLAVGSPDVEKNLHFFEASTCLNLAMRHLFDPGPSWEEKQAKAEAMLDEGVRVLEREAA